MIKVKLVAGGNILTRSDCEIADSVGVMIPTAKKSSVVDMSRTTKLTLFQSQSSKLRS